MFIVQAHNNKVPGMSSPKIKPKSNASFELRSKKTALRLVQQQDAAAAAASKEDLANKPAPPDCKVTVRLKHLEVLVEELKSSFIQLLVDRVKCKATLSKDPKKLPKLTKRLTKLHQGLHCSSS